MENQVEALNPSLTKMDFIQGAGASHAQSKLPEDKSAVAPGLWQGSYRNKAGTEARQCVVQKPIF